MKIENGWNYDAAPVDEQNGRIAAWVYDTATWLVRDGVAVTTVEAARVMLRQSIDLDEHFLAWIHRQADRDPTDAEYAAWRVHAADLAAEAPE